MAIGRQKATFSRDVQSNPCAPTLHTQPHTVPFVLLHFNPIMELDSNPIIHITGNVGVTKPTDGIVPFLENFTWILCQL